jgi:hypothetical protein
MGLCASVPEEINNEVKLESIKLSCEKLPDVDIYGDCTRIDQIPPIEMTSKRLKLIITNAVQSVDNMESIEYLIDNHTSDFTENDLNSLIRLNSDSLFDRFVKTRGVANVFGSSQARQSGIFAAIESKNQKALDHIINNYPICSYVSYHYNQVSGINAFAVIVDKLIEHNMTNNLISFIRINGYENHNVTDAKSLLDKLFATDMTEISIRPIYDSVKYRFSLEQNRDIFASVCKNRFENIAIDLLGKLNISSYFPVLQISASNKLGKIIEEITSIYKKDITQKHFDYTSTETFDGNTIMMLINNDMFDTFKLVIEKYFVNTGKIRPESAATSFGKYLIHCHTNGKDKYVDVLLKNITYTDDLLKLSSDKERRDIFEPI